MTAYEVALERLFERTGGAWRLGLERVSALMTSLGEPHTAYPSFHVAGTNGKGSTVATLDSILRGNGLRVGRYTSPHLVDFCERVVVNGTPMPQSAVTEWLTEREDEMTRLGATFFEATTAMAFDWFARADVDVAVIEVGLGGRLDATNVVQPLVAAVTQIGLDHVEYLGHTLADIAGEKAGIFKRGAAAVIGETRPEIRMLLETHAHAIGADPLLVIGRDWETTDVVVSAEGTAFTHRAQDVETRLMTPLVGSFQAGNTSVALAMLRAAGGPWAEMEAHAGALLGGIQLAGRFHREGKWLFDVAHNADGAEGVTANLRALAASRPIVAVVSVLRDKNWPDILLALSSVVDRLILTRAPTAPEGRAWDMREVAAWARDASLHAEVIEDFDAALRTAGESGETILVTGSFHTVGDAMERLQVDPLAR